MEKGNRNSSTAILEASFPLFVPPISTSLDSKVETAHQTHKRKAPEKSSSAGLRSRKGAPVD